MDPMRLDNNKGYIVQTNAYPKNEKVFIPYRKDGVEYHSVDYDDVDECRWVRTPCQTLDDIIHILQYIKKEGKRVENFRILPESILGDLHQSWDEETRSYHDDDFTNRASLFGDFDEMFAERFFGRRSLGMNQESLVFENINETKEMWKERVADTKLMRKKAKEIQISKEEK